MGHLNTHAKGKITYFIQMAKSRHRVAHLYHEVDNKEIYQIFKNIIDNFRSFIGAVIKKFL